MSYTGSSPVNSAGSAHSRSSVPLPQIPIRCLTPKGRATLLNQLGTGGSNSSSEKLNNTQDVTNLTSRAVAQSMLTVSNSCPDLTRKRNSPLAKFEGERFTENLGRSTSTGGMSSTGKLVRCRVPLSVASNLSDCSPRLVQSKVYRKRKTEYKPSATDGGQTTSTGIENCIDLTKPMRLPSARRPVTHDGRVLSDSSPISSPAQPRRRAGQYSLTARNDIRGAGRPKTKLDTGRGTLNGGGKEGGDEEGGKGEERVEREGDCPQVINNTARGPQNNGLFREQSSNLWPGPKLVLDPKTTRVLGSLTRKLSEQRLSTTSNPEIKEGYSKQTPTAEDSKLNIKSSLSDKTAECNTVKEVTTVPEGMSADSYNMCVKWVIGVESARGERTLDSIMLPTMHANPDPR